MEICLLAVIFFVLLNRCIIAQNAFKHCALKCFVWWLFDDVMIGRVSGYVIMSIANEIGNAGINAQPS